ncbi:hypothetical protein [Alkalisalibacterium limincola]|uniref:DUF1449 family protein n=1 Tax=Alkalisalibacterium limincola TaxID=2699169 RepID=A0A5C8KMN7_9GAMM|nr:hypothetical protein [Alkalisalibacterium limincola]TXK61071.1 hypothetical protein FU658_10945 [Alkalisalibacterium limincola]
MEEFLRIALSFPTLVFSILLAVSVAYWALAATGMLHIDALDGWVAPDIDGIEVDGLAGLLMRFGLGGLPLMLILTVLFFVAWLLTYFADYLLLRHMDIPVLSWLLGLAVMLGALVAGVVVTSVVLRPLRGLMARLAPPAMRSVIGQLAVVRTPTVSATHGQVSVEDGGAGLILNVRCDQGRDFQRGDRVVLIEYLEAENAYRVMAEDEFHGR